MNNTQQLIFLPPVFRFLMELTAWFWFLILAFTVNILYIGAFFLSVGLLATFNFPGDKRKDGPINIPGWLRILNEWFSGGILSIIGAWLLFGELGVLIQLILILCVIYFDRKRYYWMLGYKDSAPIYVTALRDLSFGKNI